MHTEKELTVGVDVPVAGNRVPENVNTYVEREGERREEGSESHRQLHEEINAVYMNESNAQI